MKYNKESDGIQPPHNTNPQVEASFSVVTAKSDEHAGVIYSIQNANGNRLINVPLQHLKEEHLQAVNNFHRDQFAALLPDEMILRNLNAAIVYTHPSQNEHKKYRRSYGKRNNKCKYWISAVVDREEFIDAPPRFKCYWVGYTEYSWVTFDDMIGCLEILADYHKKLHVQNKSDITLGYKACLFTLPPPPPPPNKALIDTEYLQMQSPSDIAVDDKVPKQAHSNGISSATPSVNQSQISMAHGPHSRELQESNTRAYSEMIAQQQAIDDKGWGEQAERDNRLPGRYVHQEELEGDYYIEMSKQLIVKQEPQADESEISLQINARSPHGQKSSYPVQDDLNNSTCSSPLIDVCSVDVALMPPDVVHRFPTPGVTSDVQSSLALIGTADTSTVSSDRTSQYNYTNQVDSNDWPTDRPANNTNTHTSQNIKQVAIVNSAQSSLAAANYISSTSARPPMYSFTATTAISSVRAQRRVMPNAVFVSPSLKAGSTKMTAQELSANIRYEAAMMDKEIDKLRRKIKKKRLNPPVRSISVDNIEDLEPEQLTPL